MLNFYILKNIIGGGDWNNYRLVPDIFKVNLQKEILLEIPIQ